MQLFGLLCVAVYSVVAMLVSVRLLRLAARTGETPELMIGSALLMGGAIGYPATVAWRVLAATEPGLGLHFGMAGALGLHFGAWANVLAWRAIYHRAAPWARWVAVAVTAALFLSLVDRLVAVLPAGSMSVRAETPQNLYALSLACQAAPYLFMAFSGFRYHSLLLRRMALDLADPVVANRIWLWSATSAVVVAQYVYSLLTIHLRHMAHFAAASHVVVGGLGLALTATLWLAFFPPKAYLRWVERWTTGPEAGESLA